MTVGEVLVCGVATTMLGRHWNRRRPSPPNPRHGLLALRNRVAWRYFRRWARPRRRRRVEGWLLRNGLMGFSQQRSTGCGSSSTGGHMSRFTAAIASVTALPRAQRCVWRRSSCHRRRVPVGSGRAHHIQCLPRGRAARDHRVVHRRGTTHNGARDPCVRSADRYAAIPTCGLTDVETDERWEHPVSRQHSISSCHHREPV